MTSKNGDGLRYGVTGAAENRPLASASQRSTASPRKGPEDPLIDGHIAP